MKSQRLLAALLCATAGFLFQWTIVRTNYAGNWTGLFCHGAYFPLPAGLASEHIYVFPNSHGYDGQSYHYVAHDPLRRTEVGRAVPDPARRFPRILVPGLAYALALGRTEWIDTSLFAVNLLFLGLGAYWLACLIPRPLFAVLYVLAPASIVSLDRMLVDLALSSLALGFAVYVKDEAAQWRLWVVIAAAALCRETGVLFFAAYAMHLVWRRQYVRIPVFALAMLPALVWNMVSGVGGFGFPIPFYGFIDALLHPRTYPFGELANVVIQGLWLLQLAGFLVSGALAIREGVARWQQPVQALCLLYTCFAICLTPGSYDDPFASSRILSPLLVFQFLAGRRLPMYLVSPRLWLELLPQFLRVVR